MTRVCIMGNSHVACWLSAWRQNREHFDRYADIRFFMLGGYGMGDLVTEGRSLTAPDQAGRQMFMQTSEGLDRINVDDYDRFLIVSLTFGYRNLTKLFSGYGVVSETRRPADAAFLSEACFEDSIQGLLSQSLAVGLRRKIAQLTDKPVTLAPAPCRSEDVLSGEDACFSALCETGDQAYLYERFCRAARALAAAENFSLCLQPPETMIAGGGYTQRRFARGGINSSLKEAGAQDVSHMNADFGAQALEGYFKGL